MTTSVARTQATVPVEDLFVAGMLKCRCLARHVADASFAQIRRQLADKIGWHGGTLIVADRWFPSSRTCSGCGGVRAKLTLSERTYVCDVCAMVTGRDVNAALNLAQYGRNELRIAGSGAEIENGHGADRKDRACPAGGCEASTRHRVSGSDRDRPLARRDSGIDERQRALIRNGSEQVSDELVGQGKYRVPGVLWCPRGACGRGHRRTGADVV
jgi:Putative transposase DNA-binding domain